MTDDVLDRLAAYRPADAHEWGAEQRAAVRAGLFDDLTVAPGRLRFRARYRLPAIGPIAAAAAIVTLIAGILVVVTSHAGGGSGGGAGTQAGGGAGTQAGGNAFTPPDGLSTRADIHDGQYSHLVTEQIDLGADGQPITDGPDAMTMRDYVAADGTIVSIRTGVQTGCTTFRPGDAPGIEFPTLDFFASLPTDVDALGTYLADRVEGSSSHDEAIFVVVGDMLRSAGGLASPALRAAMLAVVSRLAGVTIHRNDTDYRGRPAVRADFVDQRIRPGEVHSYYFDPATFRFVEESTRSNGEPTEYNGPSPAYSAPAQAGQDPDQLTGGGFVSIITQTSVVDDLPQEARHCPAG